MSKMMEEGIVSVIKYEGPNNVFAWKHPIEDFNIGSQLIVHESQEAIFFKDGKALDTFSAGRYTLETKNIPLLKEAVKMVTGNENIFHAEVYFVNLTTQMGVKWGTDSKVRLFDPASGLHIEIGACGSFNIKVVDSRKFLVKVVGTTNELNQGDLLNGDSNLTSGKFKSLIMNRVKSNLARIIKEQQINILEIDEHLDTLSESMQSVINENLDDYGITLPEFFITTIVTPDEDPDYRRLRQQFAEKTLKIREEEVRQAEAEAARKRKIVEAQTDAELKMVSAQGDAEATKIRAQADAEAYKMQAFAEAAEMRAKGYTYQQETSRKVGMEAMQNGITGGSTSGGGGIGDIAGLGVTLGAMGGVMNMTREAMNPIMGQSSDIGTGFGEMISDGAASSWECTSCGQKGITSNFCPNCGTPKASAPASWICPNCGTKGITSNFCPDCGNPKPDVRNDSWTCGDCGTSNITSNICPNCGKKREN